MSHLYRNLTTKNKTKHKKISTKINIQKYINKTILYLKKKTTYQCKIKYNYKLHKYI